MNTESGNEESGNDAMLYIEYLIIKCTVTEYLVKVLTVGVSDEYLPKGVARDKIDDMLHTVSVQLVKNIIQQ
jgi:hypothetical protein